MCCVLGTHGRFCPDSLLPFEPESPPSSFFAFLPPLVFFSEPDLACAGAGVTGSEIPSAGGLEGFDDENRLWWVWQEKAWVVAAIWEMEAAIGGVGAVRATRRTEEENMPCEGDAEKSLEVLVKVKIVG